LCQLAAKPPTVSTTKPNIKCFFSPSRKQLTYSPFFFSFPAEIVKTSYGPIRGEKLNYENTSYRAFKGIPYAAPPVGDLRFKVSEPSISQEKMSITNLFGVRSCM